MSVRSPSEFVSLRLTAIVPIVSRARFRRVLLLPLVAWLLSFMLAASTPIWAAPSAGRADPGIRFVIDRETFRVHVVDLRSGDRGPDVAVAIGSPAHPSPSGEFRVRQVVHDPAWNPGRTAKAQGAKRVPPSPDGPLGIAKIPILGEYALHGGASWLTVGKPVTLGCLRATDDSMRDLIVWLEAHGALGAKPTRGSGEKPQAFIRPARIVIR